MNEKTEKREKPMNTAEFFEKICGILEEKGEMPKILDYYLPTAELVLMTSPEFAPKENLDYGGSEGIYLDMGIEYVTDERSWTGDMGTFKTLRTDQEAMRIMGCLLADFIVESDAFVRSHTDDFTWEGFRVQALDADGKALSWSYLCSCREDAEKRTEELLKEYPHVVIRDNATREEWSIRC